ncbi:MAG TPA: alanine--tRNA ligase, partial [Candidatus Pacearchaeota archaeon]|nr:alanine--tRNA ligase [Candidatus Pacearchaeota archaeon]
KHQKLSRTASAGKFKSGLSDSSKETTKLHTATHLLNEALRRVLDKNIRQKGSNITPERLRFDFNFPRKLSEEEIKKVENLVNKKISEGLNVTHEEMPLKKALKIGASSEFSTRYPKIVKVYTIGDFSKEICTGPHVANTREIGKFKIIKEESIAAGIRRIKAVLE